MFAQISRCLKSKYLPFFPPARKVFRYSGMDVTLITTSQIVKTLLVDQMARHD